MKEFLLLLLFCSTMCASLSAQTTLEVNSFLKPITTKDALASVTIQSFNDKTFIIDQEALKEEGGIPFLKNLLALDDNHSFSVIYNETTGLDLKKKTIKYQHFYQGIPVEGSGYIIVLEGDTGTVPNILSRARPGGPIGPNPCASISLMNLYVSDVDGKVVADSEKDFPSYNDLTNIANQLNLDVNDLTSEIFLRWNKASGKHQYIHNIIYHNNNHSTSIGEFYKPTGFSAIENWRGILGETLIYGVVDIDDSFEDGVQRLVSSDGRLSTFDLTSLPINNFVCTEPGQNCDNGILGTDFFVPETSANQWPVSNNLERHVLQTHHAATAALAEWDDLLSSLELPLFQDIKIGASGDGRTATTLESNPLSSFIRVKFRNNVSDAMYDILGHEFTHVHFGRRLPGTDITTNTLHEALSEMIGVYVESKIAGSIDWQEGDDDPNNAVNIDFENLDHECLTEEVLNLSNEYFRGMPLLHWFYLIVNGDAFLEIEPLGIDRATSILLQGADLLPRRPDRIEDFSNAILAYTLSEFGLCSDEYQTILTSFNEICLVNYTASCEFSINGPRNWCEEYTPGRPLSWDLSSSFPNATYYWTFPHEWTIQGNRQGNSHSGPFLTVTDIPTYSSYPASFTIYVYSPQLGSEHREQITVRINDCNSDNPGGCGKNKLNGAVNYSLSKQNTESSSLVTKEKEQQRFQYHFYDLSGKRVESSTLPLDLFRQANTLPSGIYYLVQLDAVTGKHISTERRIIIR